MPLTRATNCMQEKKAGVGAYVHAAEYGTPLLFFELLTAVILCVVGEIPVLHAVNLTKYNVYRILQIVYGGKLSRFLWFL